MHLSHLCFYLDVRFGPAGVAHFSGHCRNLIVEIPYGFQKLDVVCLVPVPRGHGSEEEVRAAAREKEKAGARRSAEEVVCLPVRSGVV